MINVAVVENLANDLVIVKRTNLVENDDTLHNFGTISVKSKINFVDNLGLEDHHWIGSILCLDIKSVVYIVHTFHRSCDVYH